MKLKERIIRAILVPRIVRCLTGDPKDLKRLLEVSRIGRPGPAFRIFLERISRGIDSRSGVANMLLHVGKHANPLCKRKLVENLILNWAVKGAGIRTAMSTPDRWVPFFAVISPTMRCNLACHGCYSALYSKDGELSDEDMDRVFTECKSLGAYFSVISGGEPYLLKDMLLRLFRRHNDMFFLTFTNGTLFDESLADQLASLGNVAPAISVEGYEDQTDRRRSRGVYQKVERTMELLQARGVLFGLSVTYTSQNIDLVTSDAFVDFYHRKGACFAWYFMFMPVGRDPVLQLVPSPEQRLECGRRIAELRNRHPIFLADFWNDGVAAGGCLAAGRRYLHILNSGRVEPCVFAHFGVDNIREKSLLDSANSPFFRAIRREFPFNDIGNLRRPCMIIDNPGVLRKLVDEHVASAGHAHSEDIVRDPKVVQWVQEYGDRMKELTDPAWMALINDPASRWYHENQEYRNLFRFR